MQIFLGAKRKFIQNFYFSQECNLSSYAPLYTEEKRSEWIFRIRWKKTPNWASLPEQLSPSLPLQSSTLKHIYLQKTRKREKLEPAADNIFFLAGKNSQNFVFTRGYQG